MIKASRNSGTPQRDYFVSLTVETVNENQTFLLPISAVDHTKLLEVFARKHTLTSCRRRQSHADAVQYVLIDSIYGSVKEESRTFTLK